MKRYQVWYKLSRLSEWELLKSGTCSYKTRRGAEDCATALAAGFKTAYIETVVIEVELPA